MNIRISVLLGLISVCLTLTYSQNVAINTTGAVANNSAMLDVDAPNKGLLIPRVALTATNNNAPIGATVTTSLLVYNTATSSAGNTLVTPGYYYWDGTQWVRFITGALPGPAWMVTGNVGTNPAIHFAGTTDNVDFVIRTNNTEKMRVTAGGYAGIGVTAPASRLTVLGDGTGTVNIGNGYCGGNYSGISLNGSTGSCGVYNLLSSPTDQALYINRPNGNAMYFRENNGTQMIITSGGNVGINAGAPAVRLAINGNGVNAYATDVWVENNMHVQGNEVLTVGGRGRMRVGTAWGYVGLYAEGSSGGVNNDLVLGASSGVTRVGCNGCNTQHLLVNGNLTVNPTANTFTRVIAAGANAYMGVYTDALYNGTSAAPTFTYDGMTLSSVGTVFGDISYSSENTGGWHYWMIGAVRRMRLDQFNWLMLNGGTFSTTGADVAEEFSHDGSLEEGDVVMINADGDTEIKKCDQPKSSKVFGVISTTPGLVLNSINTNDFDAAMEKNRPANSADRANLWADYKAEHKKSHLPVALNGRTPCKVIASTPIKKGDFITSSSEPGFGEKLVGAGSYFAIALEDMPAGSGKIMVAIKNGYTNE